MTMTTKRPLLAPHILRDAADFLDHAAEMIDAGQDITGSKVVDRFRWA